MGSCFADATSSVFRHRGIAHSQWAIQCKNFRLSGAIIQSKIHEVRGIRRGSLIPSAGSELDKMHALNPHERGPPAGGQTNPHLPHQPSHRSRNQRQPEPGVEHGGADASGFTEAGHGMHQCAHRHMPQPGSEREVRSKVLTCRTPSWPRARVARSIPPRLRSWRPSTETSRRRTSKSPRLITECDRFRPGPVFTTYPTGDYAGGTSFGVPGVGPRAARSRSRMRCLRRSKNVAKSPRASGRPSRSFSAR